jgi:hypothetical protein
VTGLGGHAISEVVNLVETAAPFGTSGLARRSEHLARRSEPKGDFVR